MWIPFPEESDILILSVVTQIPLEGSQPPENLQNDRRPPWIRPVRKKTPSIARSGDSSTPEAFSPTEFLANGNGNGMDTSGMVMGEGMYMTPDVLSLFEGDLQQMFSPEFMQAPVGPSDGVAGTKVKINGRVTPP